MKRVLLYLGIAVLTFCCVGSVWLFMEKQNTKEENLGDVNDYVFSFDEVTIPNKKIVGFDNSGLDYLKYYVIEFTGEKYISYAYYFMGNHDKYIEKYKELVGSIVDYNYQEYMIKVIDTIDYGTYDEYLSSIQDVLDNNLMYIIN